MITEQLIEDLEMRPGFMRVFPKIFPLNFKYLELTIEHIYSQLSSYRHLSFPKNNYSVFTELFYMLQKPATKLTDYDINFIKNTNINKKLEIYLNYIYENQHYEDVIVIQENGHCIEFFSENEKDYDYEDLEADYTKDYTLEFLPSCIISLLRPYMNWKDRYIVLIYFKTKCWPQKKIRAVFKDYLSPKKFEIFQNLEIDSFFKGSQAELYWNKCCEEMSGNCPGQCGRDHPLLPKMEEI